MMVLSDQPDWESRGNPGERNCWRLNPPVSLNDKRSPGSREVLNPVAPLKFRWGTLCSGFGVRVYAVLYLTPDRAPRWLDSRTQRWSPVTSRHPNTPSAFFCSSQSLPHSSLSSYQSSSRSLASPASSSSSLHSLDRGSPCVRPSDAQAPSNPIPNMGQPQAAYCPPVAKEQASSCPPSITNSMVDVPIVLINGCPEPQSPPARQTPGHQGSVQPRAASPSHPCRALESHSQTLPDGPVAASPDGTL